MGKTGQKLLSTLISTGYEEISSWTSSDGKSGLDILMLIIEKSLDPSLDESQRILAGPLITDLAVKVMPSRTHPAIVLNVVRQVGKSNLIYRHF